MSYRVERAVSGRATCNNKECKDEGVKIGKDELRLGTWVETKEHASWHWRHWGCVTGKQLENLRLYLEGEDNHGSGEYRWDFLDGYDDSGKGGLDGYPDLQAKVRRVVEQGFIDPEDWKGDPEMNRLGEKGTRTAESKKQLQADKSAGMGSMEELQASLEEAKEEREQFALEGKQNTMAARACDKKIVAYEKELKNRVKQAERERNAAEKQQEKETKKRGRVKKEEDDDEEEAKPAKKKRVTKPKIEDSEDEAEVIVPAKTSRGRKTAVKKEEPEEVDVKPAAKSRGKKTAVKKEESPDMMLDELQAEEEEVKPVKKARAKKGAVKKEEEDDDDGEILTKALPAKRGGRKKAAVVKQESPEEQDEEVEEEEAEEEEAEEEEEQEEEKPKAKKAKKAAAAGGRKGRKAKA